MQDKDTNAAMAAVDHNAIVAKSNELIGELAKFELSELRLIAFCLAHFDNRSVEHRTSGNRVITARIDDLKKIFKMTTKDAYAVVKRAIIGINRKPFEHFDADDAVVCDVWFTQFKYQPRTGEFTFKISPDMEQHLMGLDGTFTKYRLEDVYQFKSPSTWKLYENLAQWRRSGVWSRSLDELRVRLGVAGKYPDWYVFNRDVIAPAVKAINNFSDLHVEYTQEKRGRSVAGLVFTIHTKKKEDDGLIDDIASPSDRLRKALLAAGLASKTAEELMQKVDARGKTEVIITKIPAMIERAKKKSTPLAQYVTGAINKELRQGKLFEAGPVNPPADYREALDCWGEKKRHKEACPVRARGAAGQRKKCQICLEKMPIDPFGV